MDKNTEVFLELARAGLWEKEARLSPFVNVDYEEVMRIAEEQSEVGLITAGLEHVVDIQVPKEILLQFIGQTLLLEQRNNSMNSFIEALIQRLKNEGVNTLLVKGQGISQCYERPLWRTSGDVDLLLDKDNYRKAQNSLSSISSKVDREDEYNLHQSYTISSWEVELHGTLRSGLGKRIDDSIDKIQTLCFNSQEVRIWENGDTKVALPAPDNDVVLVFSHILQHLFKGGIGLRQICDWCRLLWTFKDTIDRCLLKKRLEKMGIMSEWLVFASLAVNILGMPSTAMPLYKDSSLLQKRQKVLLSYIIETGNFGHNRDNTYHIKYPFIVYKTISLWQTTKDCIKMFSVFPWDSFRIWWKLLFCGIDRAIKGIT